MKLPPDQACALEVGGYINNKNLEIPVLITQEEKQQIMQALAQGSPDLPQVMPHPENDLDLHPQDYQTFDDFAQRPLS